MSLIRQRLDPQPITVVGGKQRHAPIGTTPSNKIFMMTARKHVHQPTQRLGWSGLNLPTTNRKVQPLTLGCTSTACRMTRSLMSGLWTWNVGSMNGRGTEVCEELRKRRMDVCCLQELKWRVQAALFMGVQRRR